MLLTKPAFKHHYTSSLCFQFRFKSKCTFNHVLSSNIMCQSSYMSSIKIEERLMWYFYSSDWVKVNCEVFVRRYLLSPEVLYVLFVSLSVKQVSILDNFLVKWAMASCSWFLCQFRMQDFFLRILVLNELSGRHSKLFLKITQITVLSN